ncbi:integral membrane protein, partial [Aureobasidium melanogenum]
MTDDRSGQILGVAIGFLIPTAISTALRVYTRTKILRSQAGRDDIGMVVAFTFYLVYLVCQLSGVAHGSGKKRYLVDDHTAQTGLMYWFFCEVFYTLATAALKISIGLFLLRIAVDRTHIWIIRWIMIFNVLFGVPYCLLITFQCKPVSFWWDLNPDHHGKCISPKVIVINTYIISVLNSVADWTFGILPFFIVRKLQMKRQTKIMVASILGFAALGSTATIVRTPFVHTLADFKGEFLYNNADVAIWTTVELGIGCTAANAACLRPLLSRFRAHFGVPSTQTGSRHLGGTISRGGGKRSKRSDLDDQTLVTLDELRAGGQDGGKTEVVIAGGYAHDLPPMPSPGLAGAWKTSQVVQSVEIRTSLSEGSEGEEDERRINGSRSTVAGSGVMRPGLRGRQDTISEDGQEGRKATQPYERL